jgi:hypothetical protein
MVAILDACLCLFDISRVLTGHQCPNNGHLEAECPYRQQCQANRRQDRIIDSANGGGILMTSNFTEHMGNSFCAQKCYLGILTTGDASGPTSAEAGLLHDMFRALTFGNALPVLTEAAWSEASLGKPAPYLSLVPIRQHHTYIPLIERWYFAKRGIKFAKNRVFFFDDGAFCKRPNPYPRAHAKTCDHSVPPRASHRAHRREQHTRPHQHWIQRSASLVPTA